MFVLAINALACTLIVFRLIIVNRRRTEYHTGIALATWFLAVAYFNVLLSTLSGEYLNANISETVVNIFFCIALYSCRGDLNKLVRGGNNECQ
jgi:uncharacterized membrane protein YozB (DUF420 family)